MFMKSWICAETYATTGSSVAVSSRTALRSLAMPNTPYDVPGLQRPASDSVGTYLASIVSVLGQCCTFPEGRRDRPRNPGVPGPVSSSGKEPSSAARRRASPNRARAQVAASPAPRTLPRPDHTPEVRGDDQDRLPAGGMDPRQIQLGGHDVRSIRPTATLRPLPALRHRL